MTVASILGSSVQATISCKCAYFSSLEQPDKNTLDIAIKSIPNTVGDKIFLGIHLSNLFWYSSNLSSRNEQEGRPSPIYIVILSILLAKINTLFQKLYVPKAVWALEDEHCYRAVFL